MNQKTNQQIRPIQLAYLFAILGVFILYICIIATRNTDFTDYTSQNYMDISDQIRLSPDSDELINLRKLGDYCDNGSEHLSLFYRIPELTRDATLVYRSKDVYTHLYIDDSLIYETDVPDSRLYNRSPGNLWNEVIIAKEYSGSLMKLTLDIVYDSNAITADNFYLGDGMNIIQHYVHTKLFAIILSLFMILMGIALILLDIISQNRTMYMGHALLFLGIYSILIGTWSLLETNVIQFFVRDQRILQFSNNIIMILGSMPLFMFLDYIYNVLQNKFTKIFCIIDLIYIWFCIIAQFTGIFDLHDLLVGSEVAILISSIMVFGWIIYAYIHSRHTKEDITPILLQMIGISALSFTAFTILNRHTAGDFSDRAGTLRIGMFFFIAFFGASSQIQSNRLIEKGMKYNVVKTLAYKDGLTSLGNRTAYLERLDSYPQAALQRLGIVFLDINNLKLVNDHQGHELGDQLIQTGASIIQNSFGAYGRSYRTGGDEFCVFIEAVNLENTYQAAANTFNKMIATANADPKLPFQIQIAHGFAICEDMTPEKLKEAIDLADQAMYENKAALKAQSNT